MAKRERRSQRSTDANFGGDVVKERAMERLEKTGTIVGVHVHFGSEEIVKAWQSGVNGHASIKALAVNIGLRIEAGTMQPGHRCGECGDYTPGDITSLEMLKSLVEDAVEHNRTRPIFAKEAGKALSDASYEVEYQAGRNERLDFSDLRARVEAVKKQFLALTFGVEGDQDCRAVYVESEAVYEEALGRVVNHLSEVNVELAESLGSEMVGKVEAEVAKAKALPELRQQVGKLSGDRANLRKAGAKYREQIANERQSQESRQFTPRTPRGHRGGDERSSFSRARDGRRW
ncbi:MAG: hypothetical protein HYT12_01425 [Candidatus Liptonbacteria bacterium]|nr:hypothetical protein [Candidatus Liptonbacteria bacterium]